MSIASYLIRRLLILPFILLGLVTFVFFLARVVPANPARALAGEGAGEEQVARIIAEFNLDKPLTVQYFAFLNDLVHGDLGVSVHTWRPVIEDLKTYFPATFELTLVAMFLAVIMGIILGITSAIARGTIWDALVTTFAVTGLAMPQFWLGIILQIGLALSLGLLPLGGRIDSSVALTPVTGLYLVDSVITGNWKALASCIRHIILPALTLALTSLGLFARITRNTLLETLREDYIRTARAMGHPERKVIWHGLRNALIPIVTVMGMQFAFLLGGTVVVEAVFDWPGLGLYAATAALTMDYPAIIGLTLIFGVIRMGFNLVVDVSYFIIDPRIKQG